MKLWGSQQAEKAAGETQPADKRVPKKRGGFSGNSSWQSFFLGALTFGLILFGFATVQGEFLALAIPLAVFLLAGLVFEVAPPRLAFERKLSDTRVSAYTPVDVCTVVTNQGRSLEQFWVEDVLPRGLEVVKGDHRRLVSLKAGQQISLEYSVRARRGVYEFGPLQIEAGDYLGLTQKKVRLAGSAEELWVMPQMVKVPSLHIRPRQTLGSSGLIPSRQGGPGVSFFGIRNYQPGDELRWVNWRASQRHPGVLFTNEYEQERAASVGLILDARQSSHYMVGSDSLFEHSVMAVVSLAQSFLNDGNRVGVMMYGRYIDWTFPGYGKLQRERILQSLTRAEVGESQVLNNLQYLPTRIFPSKSQIVLVSPLLTEDVDFLIWLRARDYSVLLISPDPISFQLRGLEDTEAVRLGGRMARLERYLLIRKLQQAGVEVLDWDVAVPFDRAVLTYSRSRRAVA